MLSFRWVSHTLGRSFLRRVLESGRMLAAVPRLGCCVFNS